MDRAEKILSGIDKSSTGENPPDLYCMNRDEFLVAMRQLQKEVATELLGHLVDMSLKNGRYSGVDAIGYTYLRDARDAEGRGKSFIDWDTFDEDCIT